MCRGCQEFTAAVTEGKHDALFPSQDRTPEGRLMWLDFQATAWGAHHGDPMMAIALIIKCQDAGKGPRDMYPVLYQMVKLHEQALIDTNQPNEKVMDVRSFHEAIAETFLLNTGTKIEDAINGVETKLVLGDPNMN